MDYSECRVKYRYLVDEKGEPLDIVANKGLKKFEKAFVSRKGEYGGVCIEACEDIPSILTNHHIEKAIKLVKSDNLEKASHKLNVHNYFLLHGENVVYYVINRWLQINKFELIYPEVLIDDQSIDRYVNLERHYPIDGKIKIVDIGENNKKEPVLPPEWLGRVFSNAKELHLAMNSLPNRKGKPPVRYCCIYSNSIKRESLYLDNHTMTKGAKVLSLKMNSNSNIYSKCVTVRNKSTVASNVIKLEDDIYLKVDKSLIVKQSVHQETLPKSVDIANVHQDIFPKSVDISNVHQDIFPKSVGYLCSLLQKCVRRGRHNNLLLEKVCMELNTAPNYNLPDHNFITVSGARQLVWRAYISIIEDADVFIVDNSESELIDLRSLVLLGILFQRDTTIKLSDKALKTVINTLKIVQACPDISNWRDFKNHDFKMTNNYVIGTDSHQIQDSIVLAVSNMPMMSNDRSMLEKMYTLANASLNKIKSLQNEDTFDTLNDQTDLEELKQTMKASIDMHCRPSILIELQGMIDLSLINEIPTGIPTLEKLAGYIWLNYSRCNYRISPEHTELGSSKFDNNVYSCVNRVQEHLLFDKTDNSTKQEFTQNKNKSIKSVKSNQSIKINKPSNHIQDYRVGRLAWLLLFGKKHRLSYKNKMYDIFLGGTEDELCKVKYTPQGKGSEYVEDELREKIQDAFLKSIDGKKFKIFVPNPPDGYKWIFTTRYVDISYVKGQFYVNNSKCNVLNLFDYLERVPQCATFECDNELIQLVQVATYSHESYEDVFGEDILYELSNMSNKRRLLKNDTVFNWTPHVKKNDLTLQVFRLVLSRLYTSDTDGFNGVFSVNVGPCDRKGGKTNNSISYRFEGSIYRILLLMEALYPFMIKRKNNSFEWSVNKKLSEYYHMIECIESLCKTEELAIYSHPIEILSKLWEHQERTSDKIFMGFLNKKRGYGDASHVGAGKTLCALSVCEKLHNHNLNLSQSKHSGFLVMVPSIQLISTWTDEIAKHTSGFDTYIQNPNGTFNRVKSKLNDESCKTIESIKSNTIIVTTMGRIREHPVPHSWILVIIDECLSVQNKEALQTEEAWRQSCYSEYGVLMLSATFFRSRFDKMLYMIKMLKSGLPEERDYLDAILNETIVSNVTESGRIWTTEIARISLNPNQQKNYELTYRSNSKSDSKTLYLALVKFINKNVDYLSLFFDQLDLLSSKKVLIYTNSKSEADSLVQHKRNIRTDNITRYPDTTGTHTVLSLSEGTYGLNNLVSYDTILMRPPEPDKLPQIKGRLDRPGQKSQNLELKYIVLKNTVEEALITRLEMCNNFYNNYLLPLAEFYDLAIKTAPALNDSKVIKN